MNLRTLSTVFVLVPITAFVGASAQRDGAIAETPLLQSTQTTCTASSETATGVYKARIRRTSFGIPHIEAANLASLGFGEGYAQAEDHFCAIAEQVVEARGQRAKYFGRGTRDAGPRAMAILTDSQSDNPDSQHFADQTELFSKKQWRPIPFTAKAIAADTKRNYEVSAARR